MGIHGDNNCTLTPVNEYDFSPQDELSSTCADNSPATPIPIAHMSSATQYHISKFADIYKLKNSCFLIHNIQFQISPLTFGIYIFVNVTFRYHKKYKKKEETLTEKMKRSPDKRHTQTHGSLIEIF